MSVEIGLATCTAYRELDPDDRLVLAPLEALGVRVSPAVWDDPGVDWQRFDLVVVRSTWDYTGRRDAFVTWAESVPVVLVLGARAGIVWTSPS